MRSSIAKTAFALVTVLPDLELTMVRMFSGWALIFGTETELQDAFRNQKDLCALDICLATLTPTSNKRY